MLRLTTRQSLLRKLTNLHAPRLRYSTVLSKLESARPEPQFNSKRPQILYGIARPFSPTFYATKPTLISEKTSPKLGNEVVDKPVDDHLDQVSTRNASEIGGKKNIDDGEMFGGIKADLVTIKETFALNDVPKESFYLGAAGVLPYAATSLSTVFLASEIKHAHSAGSGYLFSADTAHQMLELVTPVQIGYGAVIISFLGAIHWGLEYAGYGGHHSYRRYIYGVIAPAVAWPTMFMPVEYALITQFAAFNFLYFADARATVRGWFPPWYSTYRFVLTFFVGASIVISLVGRGQIVSHDAKLKSAVDYLKEDRDSQWEALDREDKKRRKSVEGAIENGEETNENISEPTEDSISKKGEGE